MWRVCTLVGVLLWANFLSATSYDIIPIHEAIASNLVTATSTARNDSATGSSHLGQCIELVVTNTRRSPVVISVMPGQRMIPQDETTQEMIITEQQILTLRPGDTHQIPLFAMCGERSDGSPSTDEAFIIGEIARQEIREMASYIYKKNYQHSAGQSAMWVVTDNADLTIIDHSESFVANDLRQKAAALSGQPFVPYVQEDNSNGLSTMSGQFAYRVREQGFGTLKLYDPSGAVVEVIFDRMQLKPGVYTFRFSAEGISLQSGTYKLKLFLNGRLKKERSITI